MQNSGTKLVLALVALALLLGATSWWSRYRAAHRVTQFWGPAASRLIAESAGFEAIVKSPEGNRNPTDLSRARGQAHLRHALMSDSNYRWESPLDTAEIDWKWSLRFYEGERSVNVILSEDLTAVGKIDSQTDSIVGLSCEPMAASLQAYFQALGLLDRPEASASTAAE